MDGWIDGIMKAGLVFTCVFRLGASETERRLHQKIFENYNMKVRPARYWEEKVMVRVGMTLSQLVSLVSNKHACMHAYMHYSEPFIHQVALSC